MRILVTGASGFLGGRLAQRLVAEGHDVRVLIRPTSDVRHLEGCTVGVAYGDLSDVASLRQACAGMQVVYHCAAASTDWAPWKTFHRANVEGVRHLVQCALETSQLERFIHISTTDVYGYPDVACDETHPLVDVGLGYHRSKVMGEHEIWQAHKEHGLPVTVIRPASIYGPRGTEFVLKIGLFIERNLMAVFDDGKAHAGLVYIDNAVDALIACLRHPHTVGQAYNLRDDFDRTWSDYIGAFALLLGKRTPWLNLRSTWALRVAGALEQTYALFRIKARPLLTRHAVLVMSVDQGYDIRKIQRDTGFVSQVQFDEGIQRAVAWYRDQRT